VPDFFGEKLDVLLTSVGDDQRVLIVLYGRRQSTELVEQGAGRQETKSGGDVRLPLTDLGDLRNE
jgi:hypothetical protein